MNVVKGNRFLGKTKLAIKAAIAGAVVFSHAASAGQLSGLPWNSGTACWTSAFESWRGRRADVITDYVAAKAYWNGSWATLAAHVEQRNFGALATHPAPVSFGMPMLTGDTRGRLAECARGDYDPYMHRIGAALARKGMGDAIIRLGWEANRLGGYPWAAANADLWKRCWRRHVATLRAASPGFKLDWTMSKRGSLPATVDSIYPGNDVVDFIGVNYFDRCPTVRNDAEWANAYKATNKGGPFGLGTWLSYAASKGKPLSLPEWAISDDAAEGCSPTPDDNPFFIRKMFETFSAHPGYIGYETYFNCGTGNYRVYPSSHNPRSSTEYLRLY